MFANHQITLTSTEARDILCGLRTVLGEAERNLRLAFTPDIPARQNQIDCIIDLIEKIRAVANAKTADEVIFAACHHDSNYCDCTGRGDWPT